MGLLISRDYPVGDSGGYFFFDSRDGKGGMDPITTHLVSKNIIVGLMVVIF